MNKINLFKYLKTSPEIGEFQGEEQHCLAIIVLHVLLNGSVAMSSYSHSSFAERSEIHYLPVSG
jgi:hypothetical protein